ncbi:MAG: hypothetical protein ACH37Z_12920 [Anaerolineae bacterium]
MSPNLVDAARDGKTWLNPDPNAAAPGVAIPRFRYADARFYGLGVDREGVQVPEFDRVPPAVTPVPTVAAGAAARVGIESDRGDEGLAGLEDGARLYRVPRWER